jgi:hypothetical protein
MRYAANAFFRHAVVSDVGPKASQTQAILCSFYSGWFTSTCLAAVAD